MSRDMQLATIEAYSDQAASNGNRILGPVASDAPLALPGGVSEGSSGGGKDPYRSVVRALRGRMRVVLPCAIVCAAVCGFFAYRSQKPVYRSEGLLRIAYQLPTVMNGSDKSSPMAMYDDFMQSQATLVGTRTVIQGAMKDPLWQATHWGDSPAHMTVFATFLEVEHPPKTEFLKVSFQDKDPATAAAAVNAVINSYDYVYNHQDRANDDKVFNTLREHIAVLQQQREDLEKQIRDIADRTGAVDLTSYYDAKLAEVQRLDTKLSDVQYSLTMLGSKGGGDAATQPSAGGELSAEQIAAIDPHMRQLMTELEALEDELAKMLTKKSPTHPDVKAFKDMIQSKQQRIGRYADEYRKLQRARAADPSNSGSKGEGAIPVIFQSIEALQDQEKNLTQLVDKSRRELIALNRKKMSIEDIQDQIKKIKSDVAESQGRIDHLGLEGAVGGRLSVIQKAEPAGAPVKDRRKVAAAGGGVLGAMLPVLVVVLMSFFNPRMNYSDETDPDSSNVPLLGILPTLPSDLDDPEQAAVAAHCIHQIRVMLQLGAHGQRRSVYMVTSCNSGDGKTSVTMALGLSFAAAGSRTLVIDCDMAGQGLSHRLKATSGGGLVESLRSGSPYGNIVKTKTRNLSILPVGDADAYHASLLSPTSIRNLIEEARKSFDAVLIDTGPILGSLEASVVASESDAVVLTVSRGQQQPLVRRSIRHLQNIGARVAGIIFNRANEKDFTRSQGAASLRSVSAVPQPYRALISESDEPSRFGPLARSVASFMPTSNGTQE